MSGNTNLKIKRKREKLYNKRWTDAEIKKLLEYLQERQEFEKPTAQIFYRKLLEITEIDASWDIVRWKVKNLKANYSKAEIWRKSTGAGLLEADEGVSSVQGKLRKMCRFYDELHNIFGNKTSEFPFEIYDTAVNTNIELTTTTNIDNTLDNQIEFCGFENLECSTPVMQYAGSVDIEAESADMQPSTSCSQTPSSPTETNRTGLQNKNKAVQEFAAKLKRAAPKNAIDQLSLIQSERNSFLKLKFEFKKEKFKKEFELKEKQFEEEVNERKEKLKQKQIEMEEEIKEKKAKLEFKKIEIEKDERLRILELEKQERVEKFEIEMRYKYASQNRE